MARYWKKCESCGKQFQGAHQAKTCSAACRKAKSRRPQMIRDLYLDAQGRIASLIAEAHQHPEDKQIILGLLNDLSAQVGKGCNALFDADRRKV